MSSEENNTDTNKLLQRMQSNLEMLKKDHPNPQELDEFYKLFSRWLIERNKTIDWNKIEQPKGKLYDYETEINQDISYEASKNLLNKLAVLKLNGGLGTTMGLSGPKSAIKIKNNMNFIDMVVKQLKSINRKYNASVPLILMNSFNTDERTEKMVSKYSDVDIQTFNQAQYVKINEENLLPMNLAFEKSKDSKKAFYPPGHGDLLTSINTSGILDKLLEQGVEYLFISNIDNLAATVDINILKFITENKIDFCMEVTKKTRTDIKGGTLIDYEDTMKLMEIAMVPKNKKNEFTSVKKFKIFNTNNLWINIKELKNILSKGDLNLDIITNSKVVKGEHIIQLETAVGSAVKCFNSTAGIVVPRSRFTPIKTCSDLFLCSSNLYAANKGTLTLNKNRINQVSLPVVKLIGKNFQKIKNFDNSFGNIPDIVDLDVLTVTGNVTFGENVILRGIVIICCPEGGRIDIPDGAILEDKVMFGNLPSIDC